MLPSLSPDATGVEADLAAFFGPEAEVYLRHYRGRAAGRSVFAWSWPAFGASLAWFWYRKLWLGGLLALALPMAGSWLPGGDLIGYLLAVLLAKECYLRAALAARAEADAAKLTGDRRRDFLARRGGTSRPAGVIGGVLVVALGVVASLAVLPEILQQLSAAGVLPLP